MAEGERHDAGGEHPTGVSPMVLNVLEMLDNIAHVVVAIFFIILAGSVLVYASLLLARDLPLMVRAPAAPVVSNRTEESRNGAASENNGKGRLRAARESAEGDPGSARAPEHAKPEESVGSPFLHHSLELLSTLLFVVIVLELLKTIITYLKTHNIQAIMKEFLVVGIISSIRKILLVGAESSLGSADPTAAYVKEASGTVITIAGILLLIAGLIFLQRSESGKWNTGDKPTE